MSFKRNFSAIAVASLLSFGASAATLSITPNPASVPAAGGDVTLELTVTKGSDSVQGVQGSIDVPAGISAIATVPLASLAFKTCNYDSSTNKINYLLSNLSGDLTDGSVCTLTVTVPASAAGTNYAFTHSDAPTSREMSNASGTVPAANVTYTDGLITVAAAPADNPPTFTGVVTAIPATPAPVIGRTSAEGSLQFTGVGGAGASENTGSINCTAAAPFSIVSGGTQSGLGNGAAAPVTFNCTAAATAASGNVSCTINGATPAQDFAVNCPAGVEPPPVVRPEIVPASSHLSQLLLVILLGMFGMGAVYLVRRS